MDPPNSSSYSFSDSYPGDAYTKPLRPKKFSFKRSLSVRRKLTNKIKEKDSFESDDIDAHLKSQTDSSPAGSLRFTVAPTPCASRAKEAGSGVAGSVDLAAPAAGGPGVVKSPTTVHFHVPIKPPPSSNGVESRSSGGGGAGGRVGCISPSSALSSDSEAASASSSPPLPAAKPAIYSVPENPDSNATIAEVHREPSALSLDLKVAPYSPSSTESYSEKHAITVASTTTKDDSWRSVMELTNGREEIKTRRIVEWHINPHGSNSEYSDTKGIVEDCTEEEDLEEDGMKGEDDDTLSEELTARTLPKIRTHTKHFTNYVLPGGPTRSKRPPPPYLSSTIWRIILFQIAFVFFQVLGSLSTLIDVARQSSPTPLGTHHFAMLFVAWGPVFFFGSLSGVRQNITLRRKRAKS